MAYSKKRQADDLCLKEAADVFDRNYILADPHRGRGFIVSELGADTPAASVAEIVTNEAQTITVGVAVSVAADDLLRDRSRRPCLVRQHEREARELGVMTRAIAWFRRDLSLDDNLAWASVTRAHTEVLPVYVFDRRLLDSAGSHRRRQLIASVAALATSCRARRIPHRGDRRPHRVRDSLAGEHRVDTVVWNNDVTRLAAGP